jgi:tetratricopeptide (TPR) repeat protein
MQISGGAEMNKVQARGRVNSYGRSIYRVVLVAAITALIALFVSVAQGQEISLDLKEALEYHQAGRLKDAVDIYTEVLEKNPSIVEALNWRAMAYIDLNELDKALADLNKAIQLSPNYADAYNNRGEVYRLKKMNAQAMADYRRATQINKNFPEAYYNMALILEAQKDYEAAINDYRKFLELQPKAEDRREVQEKIDSLTKLAQTAKPARPEEKRPPVAKPEAPGRPSEKVKPGFKPGPPPAALPKKPEMVPGEMPIPPEIMGLLAGMGLLGSILPVVLYIFGAVMLFLIARKTDTAPAWLAFIPIANIYLMVQIARKPIWWLALLLVLPILSMVFTPLAAFDPTGGIIVMILAAVCGLAAAVAYLLVCLGIASARGKSVVWGILFFIPCTSPIALAYLGLSK